jgi:hypothetical protein
MGVHLMLKQAQVFDTDKLTTGTAIRLSKSGYGHVNALVIKSSMEKLNVCFVSKKEQFDRSNWIDLLQADIQGVSHGFSICTTSISILLFQGQDAIQLELVREA